MLLPIPDVLTADQLSRARQLLDQADAVQGQHADSGRSSRCQAVGRDDCFRRSGRTHCLSRRLFRQKYFRHCSTATREDNLSAHTWSNAIRQVTGTGHRIRTDLSATLFFSIQMNMTVATWWSRHVRIAQRETSRGTDDPLSVDQSASRCARHSRCSR